LVGASLEGAAGRIDAAAVEQREAADGVLRVSGRGETDTSEGQQTEKLPHLTLLFDAISFDAISFDVMS
jgi:hypothetical protein